MRCLRLLVAIVSLLPLTACETMGQMALAVDESLDEITPVHPVTGRPVPNFVSDEQEVSRARQRHQQLLEAAAKEGVAVDPPRPRFNQLERIFSRLRLVAHRQHLPWQVHLIDHEEVNAFTIGGGYVYVFEGLYGRNGLVRDWDDDEIAAVLAHEIAHVTLLHVSIKETWSRVVERAQNDPYYSAAFSTEQEAEADRLSVLYMALSGYDPAASERIWGRAHQQHGSNPAKVLYLHDHPLNTERYAIVRDSSSKVKQYYSRDQINPEWEAILADNPLFPRTDVASGQPGSGIGKAIELVLKGRRTHEEAKEQAERREEAARQTPEYQAALVQLLQTQPGQDRYGRAVVQMLFRNGAAYDVASIGVTVMYLRGQTAVAQDPNCGGPAQIPAGQTVWLSCQVHNVQGASGYRVQDDGGGVQVGDRLALSPHHLPQVPLAVRLLVGDLYTVLAKS